jgi:hypothetical protein
VDSFSSCFFLAICAFIEDATRYAADPLVHEGIEWAGRDYAVQFLLGGREEGRYNTHPRRGVKQE